MKAVAVPVDGVENWTASFHVHSCFCDGQGEPADYVKSAISKGFGGIGFSGHAPLPFPCDWTMTEEGLCDYLKAVETLAAAGTGRMPIQENGDSARKCDSGALQVLKGLEIDYVPGISGPGSARFQALNLDYLVGSVHYCCPDPFEDGWCVDSAPEDFPAGLKRYFGGDYLAMAREYFHRVREMVNNEPPDIIGHLDLIRKNAEHAGFFVKSNSAYRDMVMETLYAIRASNCIMEVNTGAIGRGFMTTPYPDRWILEEAAYLNIPVTLNSDAHSPESIDAGYVDAMKLIRETGHDTLIMPYL